jgi:hypothetical protein
VWYVFGVACGTGSYDSKIHSNDLLAAIHHPEPSTGVPSSDPENDDENLEKFAYNVQSERFWWKDRGDGPEHALARNGQGLVTSDLVVYRPTSMDTIVDEIKTTRDALGRPTKVTSLDGTSVVNEVELIWGGHGVLTEIRQENNGAVTTGTKKTQMAYQMPTSGDVPLRQTSYTDPDNRSFSVIYNSGLDDKLSRPSGLKLSGNWVYQDQYLGSGQHSGRIFDDGGTSNENWSLSFDRFSRPEYAYAGSAIYERYYHNADSQVTFRENYLSDCYSYYGFSESFGYNGLGALVTRQRGIASGSTMTTVLESECLTRDPAQNVRERFVDATSSCGTPVDFEFNAQNEIASRTLPGGSAHDYVDYNDPGDLTVKNAQLGSGGTFHKFDAWHRLVKVTTNGVHVAGYEWNGLNQLVQKLDSSGTPLTNSNYYYDAAGRLLDDDQSGYWHVWSARGGRDYVGMGSGSGMAFYHVQDALGSTVAQILPSGSVYYRFLYDAYGMPTMTSSDGCSVYQVWGDLVLYSGERFLKDPGQYLFGRSLLDVELGGFLNEEAGKDTDGKRSDNPGGTRVGPPPRQPDNSAPAPLPPASPPKMAGCPCGDSTERMWVSPREGGRTWEFYPEDKEGSVENLRRILSLAAYYIGQRHVKLCHGGDCRLPEIRPTPAVGTFICAPVCVFRASFGEPVGPKKTFWTGAQYYEVPVTVKGRCQCRCRWLSYIAPPDPLGWVEDILGCIAAIRSGNALKIAEDCGALADRILDKLNDRLNRTRE